MRNARGFDHRRERERLVSLVRLSSELALPVEGLWLACATKSGIAFSKLTRTGVGVVVAGIRVLAVLLIVAAVLASLQTKNSPQTRKSCANAEQLLACAIFSALRTRWPRRCAIPCASARIAVPAGTVVAVALVLIDLCATLLLATSEQSEEASEKTANAAVEAEEAQQSKTSEGANDYTSNGTA